MFRWIEEKLGKNAKKLLTFALGGHKIEIY